MVESMEESLARMKRECVTEPLLELNLELDRKYLGSPFRTTSRESANVVWHLKVGTFSDAWYLKIERSGYEERDPLYCICDINGPDFAFYFEYYFTVETFYIMLIPKIRFDEEDPSKLVNITCQVLKRISRWDFRAEALNACSETIWWEFPKIQRKKRTWTGFCTMIKSHFGRTYPFVVVLRRSGDVYIQIQRPVPGPVHFWGTLQREESCPDFTFSLILRKGKSEIYVCNVNHFTILDDKTNNAFCCSLFVRADFPRIL